MSTGEHTRRATAPGSVKRRKFVFALAGVYLPTIGMIALMLAGIWFYHDEKTRAAIAAIVAEHTALALLLPVSLLAVQAVLLQTFWNQYLTTPLVVAERTKLILNANPSHRIEPSGGPELQELEHAINDLASRYESLQGDVESKVREAQERLADERNRLVTILSGLAHGVLVCNLDGQILLFNDHARQLLGTIHPDDPAIGGRPTLVGLGRSVFAILDRAVVTSALEHLQTRLQQGERRPVTTFVAAVRGQMIRVRAGPVTSTDARATGLLLMLDDVTRAVEAGSRKDALIASLVEAGRRSSALVRAAAEQVRGSDASMRSRMLAEIEEEAARLGETVERVAAEHAASASDEWLREDTAGGDRLGIAAEQPHGAGHPDTAGTNAAVSGPRPEYYDFDLFHRPGETDELDQRRLRDLAYTVFDTETTGLDPSQGDEIVSIGAVRVVNRRVLRDDIFEQVVDPRRPMSLETIKITGIDPEMLKGQPVIQTVLPHFHAYCADTVLVGHNAAFDMRFLQLKEQVTGIQFTQPVLDTLLLAAVIQPHIGTHALDALAERFGVDAIGRHTALGDALITAEVFLKMLPLLEDHGIVTLKQALEASERTLHARIKY